MTIAWQDGELTATCNLCWDEVTAEEAGVETFEQLRAAIGQDGWAVRKKGEEWLDVCPDCR